MDHDGRDMIGDAGPDDEQDDERRRASRGESVTAPEVLALASLLLAAISLLGLGLLNGAPYVPALYSGAGPDRSLAVTSALVGACLALLPAVLGAAALSRLPDESPWRVPAGTGVLLAATSLLLRLAVAARIAMEDDVQFVQF
jgi:hypothetical protein